MNNYFPLKRSLSILTFATLGLMAGSAFSQSAEYRRGYDQGYRDGSGATRDQAPQPMPVTGRITILDARYGFRAEACDARGAIQEIALARRHIDVLAGNSLCGDPAPGRVKRLSVVYRCGDGPEQRVAGPEGSVLALSCR